MNEFRLNGSISDEDFMILVLNNLSKEYNGILDELERHLTLSGDDALIIEVIKDKLKHRCKNLRIKMKKKGKMKRPQEPITNNPKEGAISVVSTVISLLTQNFLKMITNNK